MQYTLITHHVSYSNIDGTDHIFFTFAILGQEFKWGVAISGRHRIRWKLQQVQTGKYFKSP